MPPPITTPPATPPTPTTSRAQSGIIMTSIDSVPLFRGTTKDDIKIFIKTIEQFACLCNWTEVQKITIARLKCVGIAAQYLETIDDATLNETPWTTFKDLLTKKFDKRIIPGKAKFEFSHCTQNPRESTSDYATRLKILAKDIITWSSEAEVRAVQRKFQESELIEQFKNGLNQGIRRLVLSRVSTLESDDLTFEKVLDIAAQEEHNENIIAHTSRTNTYQANVIDSRTSPENGSPHRNRDLDYQRPGTSQYKPRQFNGSNFRNDRNISDQTRRNTNSQRIICYECGEAGHYARNCYNQRPLPKCSNCGLRGHMARECRQTEMRTCYICHQSGHLARNCRQHLNGDSQHQTAQDGLAYRNQQ